MEIRLHNSLTTLDITAQKLRTVKVTHILKCVFGTVFAVGAQTGHRVGRKINLSFAIDLNGQEGEDIKGTDYYNEENNNNKMKHHPIMSKIVNFIVAVKK
jgi:hypothetical protein